MVTDDHESSSEATLPLGDDASYVNARRYLDDIFAQKDPQTTCLSVEPHDLKDVRNLRSHFFGCLGIKRRVHVLEDEKDPIWEQAEKLEKENTEPHRKHDAKSPDLRHRDGYEKPPSMRYITALNLQAELKRIAVLRRTPALKGLVSELRASLDAWKDENESNVKRVERQRIDTTHFRTQPLPRTLGSRRRSRRRTTGTRTSDTVVNPPCRPEHDNILPDFSRKLKDVIRKERTDNGNSDTEEDSETLYDLQRDIKARLIQLVRPKTSESDVSSFMANVMGPGWKDVNDKIFKGTFPDQQLSVHNLLNGQFQRVEREDTAERACPSTLSYFHIPANNMIWVEQAIAGYFGETAPEPGDSLSSCPQTKMVLQDSYWRGQQHDTGPDSIVHNRNLRPICEKIPASVDELYRSGENTQKSLVLFMPYLHWETDRRRNKAANLIEQLEDENRLDKRETAQMWKAKRKEDRKGLDRAHLPATSMSAGYKEPNYYRTRGKNRDQILNTLAVMLWEKIRRDASNPMPAGLVHELWQRIRDEEYGNQLLVALEKVIVERAEADGIPPELQRFVWEDQKYQERREWRDILWAIKEAGQGYPTPHALEDIFWEKIKEERERSCGYNVTKTDHDQKSENQTPNEKSQGRFPSLFKGVRMDGHGQLQPKTNLARILVQAAKLYEQIITYPDQRIMEKYLFKNSSLHPRRTLDQAYFWRLRTTRLRDRDQVVYRYTNAEFAHKYRLASDKHRKDREPAPSFENAGSICTLHAKRPEPGDSWEWTRHGSYEQETGCGQCTRDIRKVSRAIMVDQLWMWVLDKDTILTCFPQRYGIADKDPSGVHQRIRIRVKTRSNPDNHVRSIFDLALIILEECFNAFFDRTRTEDQRPQTMDIFAESIGRVTNKQATAFKHLWTLSKRLTEIYQSGIEDKVDPSLLLALLNVTPEAELQREIRDIIDELDIIMHILYQQQEMITRFVKFAKEILKPPNLDVHCPGKSDSSESASETEERDNTMRIMQQQHDAFRDHSDDLLSEIDDRIKELGGLKSSAESTAQNVTELLGLKQQQASVVQAYEAMKQGEETVRQGKAIMVFTVMTIVFLPLSFMSSLFGMNAVELTGSDPSPGASNSSGLVPDEIVPFWPITFKRQILIMFTVSFGAVLAILVPAFSPIIRASISSVLQRSIAKTITWTGIYRLWLKTGWDSKDLRDGARRRVQEMKDDVRRKMQQQELLQAEVRDGVRPPRGKPSPASAKHRGPGAGGKRWWSVADGVRQGSTSRTDVEEAIVDSG